MPILDAEPQIFPSNLLSGLMHGGDDRLWWLVHTKPRQEKSIARPLLAQKIAYFLPQIEKILISGGRQRSSFVPLFSGYLFLYANDAERLRALVTNRAAQVVAVEDQERFQKDLVGIWKMIESKEPLTLESRLTRGDRVRVRSGALAGVEGTVSIPGKRCRLVVGVGLLQQGVSVEIDEAMIDRIEGGH